MARTQLNPLDQTASFTATVGTPVSASNTTADIAFLALVAPANDLVGTCYLIKAYGQVGGAQGAMQTFWVAINGTKVLTIALTLASDFSVTPLLWTLEAMVTLASTGTSASVYLDGELLWNANVNTNHASGQATVNQGAQWSISCGCTMASAAVGNSVLCRQGMIRRN